MGWGMTAENKRECCKAATAFEPSDASALVVDMNAILRKMCVYGPTVAPRSAISFFWQKHVVPSAATTIYFAFDNASLIPQARLDYLANVRYSNAVVLPGPVVNADKPLGLPWAEAWKTTSKPAMWAVLASALYDKVLRRAKPGVAYIVDPPAGPPRVHPEGTVVEAHNFGEADCRCALFARNRDCALVKTIDWDMVVQGALLFQAGVSIDIGIVYKAGEKLAFSKKRAPSDAERVPEVITPNAIGPGHRPSRAVAMLCAAGVDYCRGLKRFGFREANMVPLVATAVPEFFWITGGAGGPRTATLDVTALVAWLAGGKRAVPKTEKPLAELNAELCAIFYCAVYFALFDKMAPRGGPAIGAVDFFPGAAGVADALGGALRYPVVSYTEKDWR